MISEVCGALQSALDRYKHWEGRINRRREPRTKTTITITTGFVSRGGKHQWVGV